MSSSESDLKIVGSPYAWVVGFHESRDRISLFHDALETNGKLKKQRVRPWGATSAIDGIYKQWQVGDVVHCHYDQDKGEIWFGLNVNPSKYLLFFEFILRAIGTFIKVLHFRAYQKELTALELTYTQQLAFKMES